jgi:hypothetical protein
MLKSLAVALVAGSFGLVGTGSAQAQCGCADGAPAMPAMPGMSAVAPAVAAPAVASRSYRTYSYQPGVQSNGRSMTGGYRSAPSWDAGWKIRSH